MLGFIMPNAWLANHYGVQIRRHVLAHSYLNHLVDLEPTKVFQNAVVDTAIAILTRADSKSDARQAVIWQGAKDGSIVRKFQIEQALWENDPQCVINLGANPLEMAILSRWESSKITLNSIVDYSQGVIPYESKEEGQANRYIADHPKGPGWLPLLESASQVRRYEVDAPTAYIHYGKWLGRCREQHFFSEPKILFHRLRKKLPVQLVGALESSGCINRHALSNLILKPGVNRNELPAVLGLFNSRVANWWFVKRYGLLMEVGGFKVSQLPLPVKWRDGAERLSAFVEHMLVLHQRRRQAKASHDAALLERQIISEDNAIDQLVYELYGLTDDEIRIVEESTAAVAK